MAKFNSFTLKIDKQNRLDDGLLSDKQAKILSQNNIIYIYRNSKNSKMYIGQSKNFILRHKQHYSGTEEKFNQAKFDRVLILFSRYFNRSALDDIENQLIIYLIADQESGLVRKIDYDQRTIINRNEGNCANDYIGREIISTEILLPFWEKILYPQWVSNESVSLLRNRALVKYSPIKQLSETQIEIIDRIVQHENESFVINGDAGTGKTVLLTHLVAKMIEKGNRSIAVVVQPNWEKTGQEIFKLYGLSSESLTITTSTRLINSKRKFDTIIVDESHKLSRRGSKQMHSFNTVYENKDFESCTNHLEPLIILGQQLILMYDVLQGIRPANISRDDFRRRTGTFTNIVLETQFRIQTSSAYNYSSSDYINGIKYALYKDTGLLDMTSYDPNFNRAVFQDEKEDSYFGLFDELPLMNISRWIEDEMNYNPEHICRITAGLFEPWRQIEGKDPDKYHFFEGDIRKRWNSTQENWINSLDDDAEDQIGSVFAVQGIDLNCVGVLMGPDLKVDENGRLYGDPSAFLNDNGKPNKELLDAPETREEFTLYVLNIYYVLLTRGIDGVRLGFCNNELLKDYFKDTLEID